MGLAHCSQVCASGEKGESTQCVVSLGALNPPVCFADNGCSPCCQAAKHADIPTVQSDPKVVVQESALGSHAKSEDNMFSRQNSNLSRQNSRVSAFASMGPGMTSSTGSMTNPNTVGGMGAGMTSSAGSLASNNTRASVGGPRMVNGIAVPALPQALLKVPNGAGMESRARPPPIVTSITANGEILPQPLDAGSTDTNKPLPGERRVSHILIKHVGSDNPVSRRTGARITIGKGEAKKELATMYQTLSCGNFADFARTRSDCSSYKDGGDIDWIYPQDMMPQFESAVNLLSVGCMSGIVETDSGLHVILRTG